MEMSVLAGVAGAQWVIMETLNFNSIQEIEWYLNPTWK
jgi:hypothetical protein